MPELTSPFSVRREYKDLSLTFARNPVTNDVVAVTGAEAVKRALRTILLTTAGEVPFFPNFGSHLRALLFEPIDPITTVMIQSSIADTITAFEPRVTIQQLNVVPREEDHQYEVQLVFSLMNQSQPLTLTLYLSRLR